MSSKPREINTHRAKERLTAPPAGFAGSRNTYVKNFPDFEIVERKFYYRYICVRATVIFRRSPMCPRNAIRSAI